MRIRWISLAVIFLCCTSLVPAQDQKPKMDAGKVADIRRLMQLTGADAIGQQIAGPLMQALKPNLEKIPPEKRERAQKMSETMFQKMLAYMIAEPVSEIAIPLYDKYFTSEEIRAMIQFYESPVGRKLSDVQPKMAQELIPLAMAHSQQILQRVFAEMEADYPELRENQGPPAPKP